MKCRRCAFENPEGAKFCSDCAAPLLSQRAAEGERRVVTVLFCDVKGSTMLAETLDPEDWGEVMRGAFGVLTGAVERYDGTVARVMGDAVLAYFGAPKAHEDDAERAALAALAMRADAAVYAERMRAERGIAELAIRIGINTGLAVLGDGTGRGIEYTAMGDAVNVAARLQTAASPGSIVVGDGTRKQIEAFFELRPLGSLEVKGRAAAVPAFELLARRAAAQRATVPIVGRERELAVLREAVADVRTGRGRIVALVGDAGVGKSRLIDEVRSAWAASGGGPWSEARGQSYGAGQPYHLLRQQILSACGAADDEPAVMVRAKVEIGLAGADLEPASVAAMLAMLGMSHDAPLTGEALRNEIAHGNEALVRRRFRDEAGVNIFDDVHWSDPTSVELLLKLFALADEVPVLFIVAFRPDRQSPAWRLRQQAETDFPHLWTEIALDRLTDEESDALLGELVPGASLPEQLRRRILEKAEGNPLFLEEIVRALSDAGALVRSADGGWSVAEGATEVPVPESVHTLIAARIDRLDEPARQTLQAASVIGRTFGYRVLQRVAELNGQLDRQLSALQRVELVREVGRDPERRFAFRHPLTQDAAYRTILQRRRRDLHRKVGETLAELYADRREEYSGEIGAHFAEAGDPRAIEYLGQAGDRAMRLHAVEDALAHYTRALDLARKADADDAALGPLFSAKGRAHELRGEYDQAAAAYEEMERVARERADVPMELQALARRIIIHSAPTSVRDLPKAQELLEKALPKARELGDPATIARMEWGHLMVAAWSNRLDEARVAGTEAVALARQAGERELLAFVLNDRSRGFMQEGRYDAASLAEATALFRELGNLAMLTDALSTTAMGRVGVGDYDGALSAALEAREIAVRIANPWARSFSGFARGYVHFDRGEWGTAIEVWEDAILYGAKAGFIVVQVGPRSDLATLYRSAGAPEKADEHLRTARELAERALPDQLGWVICAEIRAALDRGDVAAAKALADGVLSRSMPRLVFIGTFMDLALVEVDLAEERVDAAMARAAPHAAGAEASSWRPGAFETDWDLVLARAELLRGDLDAADVALARGVERARMLGARRILWPLSRVWADVADARGDSALARSRRDQAREQVAAIAASLDSVGLADTFRATPEVVATIEGRPWREAPLGR
ncbi:MAG: AAA family ATPase [Chloroflexi bacterium]|nr:AAA family ATPase [Chloroflexota bacterium]